jgi:hypothetical protein
VKLLQIIGDGQLANSAPIHDAFLAFGASLLGLGLVVAVAAYRKWTGAVTVVGCTVIFLLLVGNSRIIPLVDALISVKSIAANLAGIYKVRPDEIAVYHLPRAYEYGLNYYFGRELPEWTPENTNASILFFGVNSDIHRFLDIRRGGTFDSEPTTIDRKIWWAWKKNRPNRPIHPS